MGIISFSKIDVQIIFPIIAGISKLLNKIIFDLIPKEEKIKKNPLIISIFLYLGMILTFIPYCLFRSQTEIKKNIRTSNSKLELEYEHYNINDKLRKKKYLLIFIGSLFDFCQTLAINIFCINCTYNLWILDNLFIGLFSYFILKIELYRHQYFSIIMIILFGIGLNIIEYKKTHKIDIYEIIGKIIGEIFFSALMVTNKYNMMETFSSPYEICFLEGIIGTILWVISLSIIILIGSKIDSDLLDIKKYYQNLDFSIDLLIALTTIIRGFIYNLFILLTCNAYNPNFVLIIVIIHEAYPFLLFNEKFFLNVAGFITLLFILLMVLVFLEIIQLNFCQLSKYTRKNIGNRANSEININFKPYENTFDNTDEKLFNEQNDEDLNNSVQFDV